MRDIQNETDTRKIPLQKVGVRNVKYPVTVLDKSKKTQNTTATVNLYVNLPHNFKGTHMSRFIQIFHKYHKDITMQHFLEMLNEIRVKLQAERAFGQITFPYYIEKKSPVTKSQGIMEYICSYEAQVFGGAPAPNSSLQEQYSITPSSGGISPRNAPLYKFYITIQVPIATLCPCSKAISEYGAHNQRGTVKVKLLYSEFFWIEDIIQLIEDCASTPLYSVLKRQDEKYVTEHAYDNPRFVEDVVREVYMGLIKKDFEWFSVEVQTEESIHNHDAYAYTEYSKKENVK